MIVSNHLLGKIRFPKGTIVRVNLAWIKTLEEAQKILGESKYDIYLDYPQGRTKPPKPVITLEEALGLAKYKKVKYFAVSNVEDRQTLLDLKNRLPFGVEIVPKIETKCGVENLQSILTTGCKYVMLDKDDLYVDSKEGFEELVDSVREKCRANKVKLLELQGVVFI